MERIGRYAIRYVLGDDKGSEDENLRILFWCYNSGIALDGIKLHDIKIMVIYSWFVFRVGYG